jgi:hypothetical protein
MIDPYTEGWDAYEAGQDFNSCPYPLGSEEREEWQLGFVAADDDAEFSFN